MTKARTLADNFAADINGITAGTGLTGGGTSGTVTLSIDSSVVTTTGTTTLTNKTIALGSNTVSGTIAQFNTALTDADFATLAGSETLTNKTFTAPIVNLAISAQTASYTLVLGDASKLVEINNAAGTTLTVPLNSSVAYATGTQIHILQTGAGQITVAGTAGVTVNATPGLKLRAQWSSATLIKRAENTWVLVGDLSA